MMMKRILITGGTGFLGARLRLFFDGRYDVITPTHTEFDFTDSAQSYELMRKLHPDIVIHCGAISDTSKSEKNPEFSHKVNVDGAVFTAKSSQAVGAKFIFCSSDQVYNGSRDMNPHSEDEVLSPVNVYGRHKLQAEQACLDTCPDTVCLRLTWMYDPEPLPTDKHSDLVRTVMAAIKENRPLSYPVHDYRGITYVCEVVRNIEKTFELDGGIYNFGSEGSANTYEVVQEILRLKNIASYDLRPNEEAFAASPRNLCMETSKAQRSGITFNDTLSGLKECL